MKKYILSIFTLLIYCAIIQAQCPTGNNIPFTSQQQIDDFATNYPGCTQLATIFIENTDITSLAGLSQITSVDNNLYIINNDNLTNLTGLENLTDCGGSLTIRDNANLTDLTALENLTTALTGLWIQDNGSLTNLTGLGNITAVSGNLTVRGNANLVSLTGLESITAVGAYLRIENNSSLVNLAGLDNLTTIEADLMIQSNLDLTSLVGLENLTAVGKHLRIGYNGSGLKNLTGLGSLTTVGEGLRITHNYGLTTLTGLENLTTIGQELRIWHNFTLTNLTGLENLTTINGNLEIEENGSLTALTGLENLTTIDANLWIINNGSLMTLAGLENLTTIDGDLDIENNGSLTNLAGLDNLATIDGYFDIEGNGSLMTLAGLENLTIIDENLRIINNVNLINLIGLENLTTVDGGLSITGNNSLSALTGLENLKTFDRMWIGDNDNLTTLTGLENLAAINGYLSITENDNLVTLAGLENLTAIGGFLNIGNNDALTNLIGLHNVSSINGKWKIVDNDALTGLTGIENVNETTITDLEIYQNPNLAICGLPNICNYLANEGTHEIYDNAPNCTDNTSVLNTCDDLGKIQFSTFYDINQNKMQDNGEPDYNDIMFLIESTTSTFSQNQLSAHTFYIEIGSYIVSYQQVNTNWQLTTDSISYFVSLEQGETGTLYFGFYPNDLVSDILPTVASPPTRCNELLTFNISTKNLGTTTASGTLWLEVDENILATNFIDTPDTTVTPNRYGWFFDDLYPSYAVEKQIALQIPGPPDFPVGDLLEFNAYADFEDENGAQTSATFTYAPEVRCSYDPNDKLVNPAREGDYALFDEDLIYTVRFQNTGNDVAYHVVILDTLDANLDRETFRLLGSSHAERLNTSMSTDGVLTFEFRDIFLPDSTSNFEGSQGYVWYLIRTIDGLAENTPVTNSAGIYFDLNPPVITNTTQSIMVSELPTVSVQSTENELVFNIIPNPNKGTFYVQGATNGTYRIFNAMGQAINSGLLNKDATIDISQAASGIYFIEIQDGEQVGTRRFAKQ